MNKRVKEFIEDYIKEIDLGRWKEVFESWYDTTDVMDDFFQDEEDFAELLSVLTTIGVSLSKLRDAREEIIAIHVEDIVNTLQHNHYNRVDSWNILWEDLKIRLLSSLGFTSDELYAIFNELDLAGVTPDFNNKRFVVEGL